MARRKSLFRFKIPFLRIKFRINSRTLTSVLGLLAMGSALVLIISFFKSGSLLETINSFLTFYFGNLAFLFPVLLLLTASHFFNTKKLKIIKSHVTLGLLLIFIALLGTFHAGSIGELIYENLTQDFSIIGAILILSITFVIGLILFLNTSVDAFLILIIGTVKAIANFFKTRIFQQSFNKKSDKKLFEPDKQKNGQEFIKDRRSANVSQTNPQLSGNKAQIHIRPLPQASKTGWVYPPLTILSDIQQSQADRGDVRKNADTIEKTLDSFGIRARVAEVNSGPTVTQYALEIVMGTKLSKITALSNDLALALAATTGQVRIEAPIPGRSLVGIEIPNKKSEIVTLKRLLTAPVFGNDHNPLLVPLGLDVSGNTIASDIDRMPHVLIAGQTGSGKSVLLNSWICSFLFRTKPEELRLILVDPKRVELTLYNGIPHLLTEVIVEPKQIISALNWTVAEMENRYKKFALVGVRNIASYNSLKDVEKVPYIILVIDELADLMVFAASEAEELITRIAQMARATGIHLVLATQRPSVDVITGLMKANIPTRIAFSLPSMIDSRVVLDVPGAEKLLGRGDMLFLPPDQAKPRRIQGPYISEKDVHGIVNFLKTKFPVVHYTDEVTTQEATIRKRGGTFLSSDDRDPYFNKAIEIVNQDDKASASLLQRRLSVGYARAARILDQLEAEGYVSPADGSRPREVIRRTSVEEN